ncbi:MAG: agmatinase family protein [Bdellovibrionota bacterium]
MSDFKDLIDGNPPDPSSGIFGLDVPLSQTELVLLPVPFDVTASYGSGAEFAPELILKASHQLDLEDLIFGKPYLKGILLLADRAEDIRRLNNVAKTKKNDFSLHCSDELQKAATESINDIGAQVNELVYKQAKTYLQKNKLVSVIGGDHSAPYGLLKALAEVYDNFAVLHIDAHFDLREAYEGFHWSHASIMYNCLRDFSAIKQIIHIGIRDFSAVESQKQMDLGKRSEVYFSQKLFERKACGENYAAIIDEIIGKLPEHVYISFDIDGLDPSLCPGTGTPVPGGLLFEEAIFLLERLALAGKKIIGFDLCEVASPMPNDEWNGNVGARILYKLCGAAIFSKFGRCEV